MGKAKLREWTGLRPVFTYNCTVCNTACNADVRDCVLQPDGTYKPRWPMLYCYPCALDSPAYHELVPPRRRRQPSAAVEQEHPHEHGEGDET